MSELSTGLRCIKPSRLVWFLTAPRNALLDTMPEEAGVSVRGVLDYAV